MSNDLRKYLGYKVEIIYIDRHNQLSQRLVELQAIKGSFVQAYCFRRRAPRLFRTDHILAFHLQERDAIRGKGAV